MKTIITLTLATALAAGTFQASAQDDALARLKAQLAAEQQQLGGGQSTTDTSAAAPVAETATAPAMTPADNANDPAAQLRARRAQEQQQLGGGVGGQPAGNSFYTTAPATPAMDNQPAMDAQAQVVDYTPSTSSSLSTNGITFNFRNAALSDVLAYMSDAAGFTIVLNAQMNNRVTVISTHPMSKDKAVDVLNSVLNQNGLAAVRGDDDTLTIMNKNDAGRQIIPVKEGNIYTNIPKNVEIVTQIIPIRFVDAQQLVVDISPFTQTAINVVANQAGNSIIITDTQANIRHVMQIIESIDSSAQMETSVQVFPLKYANPNDVVATLSGVFPSTTGGAQTIGVGGRGGGAGGFAALFGGGGGRGGGGGGNTSQARVQKAQQVLAVADGRTQSVVVTAAKDMMPQIKDMIDQMDVASPRDGNVATIHLDNADPYEAAQVLQQMFGGNQQRNNTSSTADVLTSRAGQTFSTSGCGTTTTGGGGTRSAAGF